MTSLREYYFYLWYCWFALFLSLQSLAAALNSSFIMPSSTIYPTSILQNNTTYTTLASHQTIHTTTTYTHIVPSPTSTLSAPANSSSSMNSTTAPKPRPPKQGAMAKLSAFGIVMLSLGGVLIVVLVVCLLVICCHGRERGPSGPHVPHSNVKMKPWRSTELSTANELTDHTIDALEDNNHSQSHQNVGLTNSPRTSPNLSAPSANNNTISTPTGTFRNLSTHPGGDLGEFGRKLSLGRQAYEIPTVTSELEKPAEHKNEPAQEAKGKQDDMTTIHFV